VCEHASGKVAKLVCPYHKWAFELDGNLIGFVFGAAMAFFMGWPNLDPAWRLLITTGFCGGLTTFSTFSAEVLSMLMHGRYSWAAAPVSALVLGSLLMTFAGFALVRWLG